MKKILFIIQSYPSKRSANVLCDEKIIRELLNDGGYEIHCLCSQYEFEKLEEKTGNVKIHRIKRGKFWNEFTLAKKNSASRRAGYVIKTQRILLRLMQFLFIPIYPKVQILLSRKFAKEAIKLHKREKFDLIISEYNGEETLHAGYILKKKFGSVKFMPIFWDGLAMKSPAKYLPQKFARRRLKKYEQKIAMKADKLIHMDISNQAYSSYLRDNLCAEKYKFLGLPGVVKPTPVEGEAQFIRKDKINIVFAGILELPERDPEPIIRAMAGTSFARNVNLIFLCSGKGRKKLQELQAGFPGVIIINDYVNRDEIGKIFQEVDMFLNFGGSNPYMMPSKILEYMSYGKPIISCYYIDNDSSKRYLKDYPLAICIDTRKAGVQLVEELEESFNKLLTSRIRFEEVQELYKQNTPKAYVCEIQKLLYQ